MKIPDKFWNFLHRELQEAKAILSCSRCRDTFKHLDINGPNGRVFGVYRRINEHNYGVLNPHVSIESHPTGKEDKRINLAQIVNKSLYIEHSVISLIAPIREDYLMSIIERREIIIPDKY